MSDGAFAVRGFNPCESLLRHSPEQLRRFLRRMKTLELNTLIVHYDYGWRRHKAILLEETAAAGVGITLMTFGPRTFFRLVDWTPAWFAKDGAGRPHTVEPECETHPCRFAPGAVEAFAHGARLWLRSLPPEIRRVHMRAGDGLKFCQCPKCRELPREETWQPFVAAFVDAALATRPGLAFEADVYVKRYNLPRDRAAHAAMHRIMYDTFFRRPAVPLGVDAGDRDMVFHAASEARPDAASVNEYHAHRLGEWARAYPGKVYIHENAMAQSFQGVFQHNTGALLRDLARYRRLGLQGVCYEAYEPGYEYFAGQFETLARALLDPDAAADYAPDALETELATRGAMDFFCMDARFPLEQYLADPFARRHAALCRRNFLDPAPAAYRDVVAFAFGHAERLDPLMMGFFNAKWGVYKGKLSFARAGAEARRLLSYTKLWDYMETVPDDRDPVAAVRELILDLAENVAAPEASVRLAAAAV